MPILRIGKTFKAIFKNLIILLPNLSSMEKHPALNLINKVIRFWVLR
jgi:hypothetical protein